MAKSGKRMAEALIALHKIKKGGYCLSKDQFKLLAGKRFLKKAYMAEVENCLNEDDFMVLYYYRREDPEYIAVVSFKWADKVLVGRGVRDTTFQSLIDQDDELDEAVPED